MRRWFTATPDEVFRAWTEPELIRGWMTPMGTAEAEIDLRVGGQFRIVMAGEGTTIKHTGEYLEIDPPQRLVFTWRSEYTGREPTLVTVVLRRHEGGTELVLTHERLPEQAAPSHGQGWGLMLGRLAQALDKKER